MLSSIKDSARIPFIIGVACILLVAGFSAYWLLIRADYKPLFPELQIEDAAEIASQLDKIESSYRINGSSGALEVPAKDVHSTRLKLMSSNTALKSGIGYEVFDNSDFGMTEFAQKINYQRALEGELQRTISSLDHIKNARVHLVMPDKKLFRDNKQEPTASVTLLLQNGAYLDRGQIVGMQRLVSAAVPRLKESMVTISDHKGKTLSQPVPEDQYVQMVPWQLQQKMNMENYLANKITKVLAKGFDVEKLGISVDIAMDFSQVKTMEEQMIPAENGLAISKEKESRIGVSGQKNKKSGQNVTREVEYKLGKSIAETIEAPGRITKVNIGVMLPSVLSENKKEEIQRLIEVAAGVDSNRGDSIAIYSYDLPDEPVIAVISNEMDHFPVLENALDSSMPNVDLLQVKVAEDSLGIPFLERVKEHQIFIIALCAFSFLFFIGYIFLRRTADKKRKKLDAFEREKVLMQLQHWLSETPQS